MRVFRLISVLIAMVWATSALAEEPPLNGGWTTYYGNPAHYEYSGDAGTACRISAEEHLNSAELGTEVKESDNWWHKRCYYTNPIGGHYSDYTQIYFDCPTDRIRVSPGYCFPAPLVMRQQELPYLPFSGGLGGIGEFSAMGEPIPLADDQNQCPDDCETNGQQSDAEDPTAGNPVVIASGAKFEVARDYSSGGLIPLTFSRSYRSFASSPFGQVGMGWSSTYDRKLVLMSGTSVDVYTETGALQQFTKSAGTWNRTYSDMTGRLVEVTSGTVFEFINAADRTDRFELVNGAFRLTQVRWRNGYQQDLTYNSASGKLATVTDSFARALTFTWDHDLITSVEAPGQYKISYSYGRVELGLGIARGSELLTKVTRQSLVTGGTEEIEYLYEDANYRHLLTGIVDGNGNRYSTYEYDQYGRAISTEHANGAGHFEIEYDDVNLYPHRHKSARARGRSTTSACAKGR